MKKSQFERFKQYAKIICNDIEDEDGKKHIQLFIDNSGEDFISLIVLLAAWLVKLDFEEDEAFCCIRYAQQVAARRIFNPLQPIEDLEA